MRRLISNGSFLLILLFTSACSEYQKVVNGDDFEKKFEMANKLYEKEQYARALPLYDELRRIYLGKKEAEITLYRQAYCEYHLNDLRLAAYHFQKFVESHPFSKHTEDCAYMYCFCQYELSPKTTLDQSFSENAMNSFQQFVSRYPGSKHVADCNKYIDELRGKIEVKALRMPRCTIRFVIIRRLFGL